MSDSKKIKLLLLQKIYKNLSSIVLDLSSHLTFLHNNFFIDYGSKQNILLRLNEIQKTINISYNNYIIEKIDISNNIDTWFNNISVPNIHNYILNFTNFITLKDFPLSQQIKEIGQIMSSIGFNNLDCMLKFFIGDNYEIFFDKSVNTLISEINNIFVPLSFEFYNVNKNEEYYWRVPTVFDEIDILELSRELWIKINNRYIKIVGIFKNDNLGIVYKTAQLNYPLFFKNKSDLEIELEKTDIEKKFLKSFLKYEYIGNFYTFTLSDYVLYIRKIYLKYLELCSTTFLTIMKDFVSKSNNFKKMFDIIFLLLLGSAESVDIANLLLGLIKGKKFNAQNIYTLIINNLSFNLQIKLKKTQNHMKQEIERLKELSYEDIDYKKQLLANRNIPDNIKTLTLEKIQEMKLYNNEYYKQLTFVKHILNFPWSSQNDELFYRNLKDTTTESINYLIKIEDKLKNTSYGHMEAKKSLLEIIGKWISNPSSQGSSFGFVGPPGVGKTLLAKSLGQSLNIPFVQITLGGQNDGELLHGHGYTYSGSQPGLIIKKMVEAGKSRCILYFDELDKTTSKNGNINEITSILIHLTDPNMNKTFQDRFFQGIEFPLDKVIMIFSYNDSSQVDSILLDRLKEIKIKPYATIEKIKIVKEFIIPELVKSIGLENEKWTLLTEDIIEYIIENYTNEAGVRDIKRHIEKIFLSLNLDKIYKKGFFAKGETNDLVLSKDNINNIIEQTQQENMKIHPKSAIGIVNGLYATSNGNGGIVPIQIFNHFSSTSNSYEIKLTGKQGDVMKESVHCSLTTALDYIRRNKEKYSFIENLDSYLLNNFKHGFHVHTPSTSTPKDGPSAGSAFTCAFISRILNKKIRNDIAMTGEIELTGKITKIGGLDFKLIGAKKAGVKLVFVPKENEKDMDEIKIKFPKLLDDNFKFQLFDYVDEIIDIIFE